MLYISTKTVIKQNKNKSSTADLASQTQRLQRNCVRSVELHGKSKILYSIIAVDCKSELTMINEFNVKSSYINVIFEKK